MGVPPPRPPWHSLIRNPWMHRVPMDPRKSTWYESKWDRFNHKANVAAATFGLFFSLICLLALVSFAIVMILRDLLS